MERGLEDKKHISQLYQFYRKHLLIDVMPFWENRTADKEWGGYLTSFDRVGNLENYDKYMWLQARQLWMFSALYNKVEKREDWLELAQLGRDFIVNHSYAGNGRWHYQLDRYGRVKKGTISIFTDMFVLAALCEYVIASGNQQDMPLIDQTYHQVKASIFSKDFVDLYPYDGNPKYKRHPLYSLALWTMSNAQQLIGSNEVKELIDDLLEQILYVFAKDEYGILVETLLENDEIIKDAEGCLINPGHIFQSMWFCIEEGTRRKDPALIKRATHIIEWAYEYGYDAQHGGILSFTSIDKAVPQYTSWHKEKNIVWDDKVWWVQAETLYALILKAIQDKDNGYFSKFLDLHQWCQKYFFDPQYGEWYVKLKRDGSVKESHKGNVGTVQKAAFHLPRGLMLIMKALQEE